MTVPTKTLTIDVFESDGTAISGATITLKMTGYDIYQDQVVDRAEESTTTSPAGRATFAIFPNTLGERLDARGQHTAYVLKIRHPVNNRKIYQTVFRMPNADSNLTDLAGNVEPATASPVVVAAGIVVKLSDGTYAVRVLQTSGGGISITNGDGEDDNPTIALANDVAAFEALTGTGIPARTAADTWALRTLAAPAAGITIANPAGIAGNPTLALADDLAALEGLATTGLAVRTAASAWAARTLTAPAAGITITNGDGVAGNPTLVLANDLAALEGLGATGLAARTGADAWAQRSIAAGANIAVTNGDGVAGNPSIAVTGIGVTIQAWDADLDALAALPATAGMLSRTGAGAFAARTLQAGANIALTNADGSAGNPSIAVSGIGVTIQAWDADLDAIAALAATAGMLARTGAGAFTARTLTAPAAGFTITNSTGAAGNPTFVLADDLNALEGLATTGLAVRTAASTWATRTLTQGNGTLVTNGDGTAGNPTVAADLTGGSGAALAAAASAGAATSLARSDHAHQYQLESLVIACSDETTALTVGTGKVTFRMPYAFTLVGLPRASLTTAQASGSIFTVNIKETGVTIFSTKITIDNTEKTTTTAATPPVVSDTALADDAEMTVDIDQIGDGTAKGLKVVLIGRKSS